MKALKKFLLLVLPIAILMFSVGCSNKNQSKLQNAEKSMIPMKGFYWKAQKENKTIYLAASMQPSKANLEYENDILKGILKDTDALALEINFKDKKLVKDLQKEQKNIIYLNKDEELKKLLTQEEQRKLDKILESLDIKYRDVKNLSPTGFLCLIKQIESEKAGLNGISLNGFLADKFEESKKSIESLETNKTQVEIIKKSEYDLKNFINNYKASTINDKSKSMNEDMYAFIKGDSVYMNQQIELIKKEDIKEYDLNYVKRNAQMAKKIDELSKQNKTYIVSVGAFHYFGENNLLNNLENMGYKITPIK